MSCKSILIVEDDADIRESLHDVLEVEGYEVFAVANGQEALDRLKILPTPCLVLLDLMMPVMNGWEFLEAKQGDLKIAPIPVVIVSAVIDQAKAKSKAAAGFIKKPIELNTLLEVVRQYCG